MYIAMNSVYILPLSGELSAGLKRDYNGDIKDLGKGDYSVEIKDIEKSEDCSTIKVDEELGINNIEVNDRVVLVEKQRYHIFMILNTHCSTRKIKFLLIKKIYFVYSKDIFMFYNYIRKLFYQLFK